MSSGTPQPLNARLLKEREDREISGYPDNLALRVHRAISWIGRGEAAKDDDDIAFVCFWIAFNAAYAEDIQENVEAPERDQFGSYFEKILRLDGERKIYEAIWNRFSGPVRVLLANKYVYQPFWKHVNGVPGNSDWQARFDYEQERISQTLVSQDTSRVLSLLFDRLYVLRNQILHGGATWNSSVNRDQVRDGAAIMGFLLPVFITVMMDHPREPWGANYYPVVGA